MQYLALGKERQDYGVLPEEAHALFRKLREELTTRWREADEETCRTLRFHAGLLDRLAGCLLQVRRMVDHRDDLVAALPGLLAQVPANAQAPAQPTAMAAFAANEATTDFESLLFHARAVLDQLTFVVSRLHGESCDKYSKLQNVLGNFVEGSEPARALDGVVSEAAALAGVLTDLEHTSLRSKVTHRETISAATTAAFTVHLLGDGRELLFDCEAFGFGVLSTTRTLATEVPFVVLNGTAQYLGVGDSLELSQLEPRWSNPTVRFSEWLDDSKRGPLLSVVSEMTPDGFGWRQEHLHAEVLEHAIEANPGS